jgi:hypothetical protein
MGSESKGAALLSGSALKGLLIGTVVTTLLLAAEEGARPVRQAAWVLVGVTLYTVTEAYGSHLPTHADNRFWSYVAGLARAIADEAPQVLACLPTVILLLLAAKLGWHDDRRNPDGTVTVGYTTIVLNLNVVLVFILGFIAAGRGRFSRWWTLLFGLMNAGLGWLIVTTELILV